jgi:hypothetical protein
MKKLFYTLVLALILNSALLIQNSQAQWTSINMGTGLNMNLYSFVTLGSNLFAGTTDGVFRSTNNGMNWAQVGLNNQTVYSLITKGDTIFAGSYGFYISVNNGATWTQPSVLGRPVNSIAVSGTTVFAGSSNNGIYRSSNAGTGWTQIGLIGKTINSLAVLGTNIFAGIQDSGVFLSTNNGTNWTKTALNNRTVYTFAIIGTTIFAGTLNFGVYSSPNNGSSWTQTSLNNLSVRSFTVNGSNLFAGIGNGGVYFSSNNGTTWLVKNQGFGTSLPSIYSLVILNGYILGGSYGEFVYRRSYSEIIGIRNISTEIPSAYSLSQNYPNPFNPSTVIRFDIPKASVGQTFLFVTIKVFDINGREVATLVNEQLAPGTYETTFDGSALSSGTYFYKLTTDNFTQTKRLTLLK